ncbi:MAG: methyltransferase [bacterium]
MTYIIEKIDNQGRGITFINDKIAFIKGALPGDEIEVNVTVEKKKYIIGKIKKIVKPSDMRIKSPCAFSSKCGGCQFLETTYEDSFSLKMDSYKKNLMKNGFEMPIKFHKNDSPFNYRNKISLKIVDYKIGFYEEVSNKVVEINECKIAGNAINVFFSEIKDLNIKNGFVNVRTNYKNDILVSINTKDYVDASDLNAAGVIVNNELVKGEKFFLDKINDLIFEISYDSFFQVNPYVTGKLFDVINDNINDTDTVLDLYCGVGTLGLNASKKASKVFGIEVVKNAVINANNNALINHIENASFKVGDLSKNIKVKDDFNTLIVDPPRSGLDTVVMDFIKESLPNKIIYVSCDMHTLIRDLKILKESYNISSIDAFDMFSFSYHIESVCVLSRK